jgi:hypothetical protein
VFIIEINSQLQPDPNDETAALLRVLIYKIDNTTFGSDVPALPQWTGPPRTIVHIQAVLFSSLAISLFSAFLAMLGKQWLNRYESTDIRGSVIDRGRSRQRKLDGIVTWYFGHVMALLPLMLQAALVLLGCALSRYLWDINIVIASIALAATSFGILLYLLAVIAGAAYKSCPYQMPGSPVLRYLGKGLHSALRSMFERSQVIDTLQYLLWSYHPWWSRNKIIPFLKALASKLPLLLFLDLYSFIFITTLIIPSL